MDLTSTSSLRRQCECRGLWPCRRRRWCLETESRWFASGTSVCQTLVASFSSSCRFCKATRIYRPASALPVVELPQTMEPPWPAGTQDVQEYPSPSSFCGRLVQVRACSVHDLRDNSQPNSDWAEVEIATNPWPIHLRDPCKTCPHLLDHLLELQRSLRLWNRAKI